MSYTPINPYVYEAAYAGALAGMNASAYALQSNATTYAMNAAIAGAWAQEFDTVWNSATTLNQLQFDAIRSLSETNWYDRTPQALIYTDWASNGNTSALTPATYLPTVTALIGVINAGSLYFTAQGIAPPAFGGNATSIGGIPVSNVVATRSFLLAANGSRYVSRQDVVNLLDFLPAGTDPATVTDWITYLEAFVLGIPNGGKGFVPFIGDIPISRTWKIYSDAEHGNKTQIEIEFEQGNPIGTTLNQIVANFSNISGTAASIDYVGTGAGGQRMMRLTGCTGVTLANAANIEGQMVRVWDSSASYLHNTVRSNVCKVERDGVMWVLNADPASVVDASGTIKWEIEYGAVDFCCYASTLRNLVVQPGAGQSLTYLVHHGEATGANSPAISNCLGDNWLLQSTQPNTRKFTEGFAIAKNYVPLPTSTHYTAVVYAGPDGNVTVPQVYLPNGISEGTWNNIRVIGGPRGTAIAGFSGTGQAEQHLYTNTLVNACRCIWANPSNFNLASPFYKAHATFQNIKCGALYDTAFISTCAARPFKVDMMTGESPGFRIYEGLDGVTALPLILERIYMSFFGTFKEHVTGELIKLATPEFVTLNDIAVALQTDTSTYTIKNNGNTRISLKGFSVYGKTTRAGSNAELLAANKGPWSYNDGDQLQLFSAAGVPQTLTITKAAVEAAMAARVGSYTADRNKLTAFELEAWITANFSGGKCYGKWDNSELRLYSTAMGAAAYLKVGVPAGTDLNAKLGFSTGAVAGTAQSQSSRDTGGWMMETSTIPTDFAYEFQAMGISFVSNTAYPLDSFPMRSYGTTQKTIGNVYPLYFEVTQAGGAGTTVTATFATLAIPLNDQQDTNYKPEIVLVKSSAGCAAGAKLRDGTLTIAQNLISFGIQADPGGTETVTWGIRINR